MTIWLNVPTKCRLKDQLQYDLARREEAICVDTWTIVVVHFWNDEWIRARKCTLIYNSYYT